MFSTVLLIVVLGFVHLSVCSTPGDDGVRDCPRFDYEYKLLERILLLEHKTADIERKQYVLERKNEELANTLKQQKLEYEELYEKQDARIGQQKLELTRENEEQDTAMAAMKAELTESLISMISETNDNQSVVLYELASRMETFEQDADAKINHTHPSFTAQMLSTPEKVGNTLIFDSVLTNDDNMYDSTTGIFQVKTTGKYLISVTLSTANKKNFEASLMRDSQELAAMEPDNQGTDNSNDNDTASVTVVVNLNAGDSVYVKSVHKATELRGGQYNVFTGVSLS